MVQGRSRIIGGPHLYSGESGPRILWTHVGALWLVLVVSAAFFGWSSLLILAATVGTCVVVDLAMCRLLGSRNPASLPHAVLTGLLLGLALPVMSEMGVMLRIGVVAAVVGSLLGKWIFGGMGHYVWHPALVGILAVHFLFQGQLGGDGGQRYLLLSNNCLFNGDLSKNQAPQSYRFGQERSELLQPNDYQGWSVSVPAEPAQAWRLYRPVQILQELGRGEIKNPGANSGPAPSAVAQAIYLALPPLSDAVIGSTGGGLGETSVVAILLGGLFLIYRGYVRWQLPVSFLFAAAVSAAVLPLPVGPSGELVWFPALSGMSRAGAANGFDDWWRVLAVGLSYVSFHLCSGGLMLAAFFLAGDMATRPIRLSGQIIFGLGAGVLTIVARIYGGWAMAPLGAYSALLVMNTLTPLIDRLTRPKPRGSQSVV